MNNSTVTNSTSAESAAAAAEDSPTSMVPFYLVVIGSLLAILNCLFLLTEYCSRIFPYVACFTGTIFAQVHASSLGEGITAAIVGWEASCG